MEMQTTVLQNPNGINIIKLLKITKSNEDLNDKISESKEFCMDLEKRNNKVQM